jgi:signal transduction histidine kinase/ActR/RegA family two-component response regulator
MSASRNWLRGCIVGIAASAIIVSLGGYLFDDNAQVLFFVVPVVAAWSGGLVAGLFATGLSAVLGSYFFIQHTGFVISDPTDRVRVATFLVVGSLISWLIESLDSARRRLEDRQQQLERQQELLADADRRKDEFLAILAHELRNPLTPISNALQLWPLVDKDPIEMDNLRAMMDRQVRQITRLINDLMDVSRITRGKIELDKQPVDLSTLLQHAIESIQPYIESYGQQVTVTFPTEPVFVDGDPARLTQVLGNLLNNAAKYSGRGAVIWATVSRIGGEALASIRDNGPGIPQHMLSDIFEMFRQVDGSLTRTNGGLGIGLTLVKQLVELHGGTVEARSDGPGKGSEFAIKLPALVTTGSPAVGRAERRSKTIHALPQRRILVVDDIQESARTLAMMLRGMGQEVAVVHDGLTAIEWALSRRPDAVFLDIAMPKLDGYEVARRLRGSFETATIVLVALTGYGQESDRRQALEAGFNYHMVKPPNLDALEKVLLAVPESAPSLTAV